MPTFSGKGIYSGGIVTKGTSPDNKIRISPFLLNLFSNQVTGEGDVGNNVSKEITVNFGGLVGGTAIRQSVKIIAYTLNTGPGSGSIWIYYDENTLDISFSTAAPTNKVVFARVYWNTLATSMSDIHIDLNPRTESYIAETTNPNDAKYFYHNTQLFVGGQLNIPLANMSIMSDVLQDNALSIHGDSYFITLTQDSDVFGAGNQIKLKAVKHIERLPNRRYKTYNTKEDPQYGVGSGIALAKTFNLNDVKGDNIYVVVDKTSGTPDIVRASQLGSLGITIGNSHHLIAKSVGPHNLAGVLSPSLASLSSIVFKAETNRTGNNSVRHSFADMVRNLEPSGFLKGFQLQPTGTDNAILVPDITGNVNGYIFNVDSTSVDIKAAPASGHRQDFVYLQIAKKEDPDIVINTTLLVTTDIDYRTHPDPFTNSRVKAYLETDLDVDTRSGPNYTYNTSQGYYEASNPNPNSNTKYYALPLGIISRFNQGSASNANPNGGSLRLDGKSHNIIHSDEIFTTAPICKTRGDYRSILMESLKLVLEGNLNKLEESVYAPSVLSKKPFQVDYLTSFSEGTEVGSTDGGRRLWTGNTSKEETIGFAFQHDDGFTCPYGDFSYVISGSSTIQLRVPSSVENDTSIAVLVNGQPKDVKVRWASDGTDVELIGVWTPTYSTDGTIVTLQNININRAASSYASHTSGGPATILVSFVVKHNKAAGFTKPPLAFYQVARNGQLGKDDNFALAPDRASKPELHRVLNGAGSRSITVNSMIHRDKLYVVRSGIKEKFYAHQLHYVVEGSGLALTPYIIPETYTIQSSDFPNEAGVYKLLGLIDVLDEEGNSVLVKNIEWLPVGNYRISINAAIPTSKTLTFVFGIDGQQLDYSPGSLEISNLTTAYRNAYSLLATASGELYYHYTSTTDATQDGSLIVGFSSYKGKLNIFAESTLTGSYIAIPVTVTGFGTNLIKIKTLIDTDTYNSLSTEQKSVFEVHAGTVYRVKSNTPLMFAALRTLNESGSIVFKYKYGASPFTKVSANFNGTIIDDGVLILSTDGVANESSSLYSPVSERFPVVQGIEVIGQDVESSPIGINPIWAYNQDKELATTGSSISLDGRYSFGVFINPGSGLAVWACLVKVGVKIYMFIYEVRDGQLIVTNPNQAFISELRYHLRELA